MQIALAQLLAKAKPHRLLIEPTGLGHPKEVLGVLSADYNRESIALNKIITLVDARKISDSRYTQHDVFRQQLEIADIVLANKTDQYGQAEVEALEVFLAVQLGNSNVEVRTTSFGKIDFGLLAGGSNSISNVQPQDDKPVDNGRDNNVVNHNSHSHEHEQHTLVSSDESNTDTVFSDNDIIRKENHGEGFASVGWQFSPAKVFSFNKVKKLLGTIPAERVKGVFICDTGVYAINIADSTMTIQELDETPDSRVEVITVDHINHEELQAVLLNCLESGR
jgi:G3E family GTPase